MTDVHILGYIELQEWIDQTIQFVRNPEKFFAEGKLIILQDVMRHFQQEEGPDGKWAPLKPMTILRRRNKGRMMILQDTGDFKDSVTAVSDSKGAEAGTSKPQARAHQYGYDPRNLPARTYAWLSEEAQERLADKLKIHLIGTN